MPVMVWTSMLIMTNTVSYLGSRTDAGGRDNAGVSVDEHAAAHNPDRRAAALPQAALEGAARTALWLGHSVVLPVLSRSLWQPSVQAGGHRVLL